jgi:hypothetical protein
MNDRKPDRRAPLSLVSKWLPWIVGLLCVIACIPSLSARVLFNSAQVARLRGTITPARYVAALARLPDDTHMRWQTGAALAEAGQITAATDVLSPLVHQPTTHKQATTMLLTTLVLAGREPEAARIYQSLDTPPDLPPPIAARVLEGFFRGNDVAPPEMTRQLLTRVFGLSEHVEAFQPFGRRLSDPNFWSSDVGQRSRQALQWYTRPITDSDRQTTPPEPDRSLVAEQLGVPAEAISFGPELVKNGGFEHYDRLNARIVGWSYSFLSLGNPWNLAAFVVGVDNTSPWNGALSARIDGLYQERAAEREHARAGLWHKGIGIKPDTSYVVSFAYRTRQAQGEIAAIWLTGEPDVLWQHDKHLPPTQGEWKHQTIVGSNRSGRQATINPLLRSWDEGSVWFDDVSIREIVVD